MRLTEIHPLINGLVRELPDDVGLLVSPGWRRDWLAAAESILVLLYPDEATGEIEQAPTKVSMQEGHVEGEGQAGVAREHGSGEPSQPLLPSDRVENKTDGPSVIAAAPIEVPAAQTSGEGESGVGPAIPESTTGKTGADQTTVPAPLTLAAKLRALNAEHPEYTSREVAAALGETPERVRSNSAANKIKWARQKPGPTTTLAQYFKPEPKAPPVEQEPPSSDPDDNPDHSRRNQVARLHGSEPGLTPREAELRLGMSPMSLRSFSGELGIEWAAPADTSVAVEPRTLRDKVAAMHRVHPTWTARMIANALGAPYSSVSVYLVAARKEAA